MSIIQFCMSLPTAAEGGEYILQSVGNSPSAVAFKNEFVRRKTALVSAVAAGQNRGEAKGKQGKGEGGEGGGGDGVGVQAKEANVASVAVAGAKKKAKKGKKVLDPTLLGFNVITDRIMVGEIQRLEE